MKKFLALLLASIMMMSTAACGSTSGNETATAEKTETTEATESFEEGTEGTEEYTGPTGEITFSAWGSDAEIECDQKAVDAFMASHPGTKVNLEIFNEDYATTVETRFLGGQAPDVIYGHPSTLIKWIEEGMLQPITDVYESHEELWDEEVYETSLYESYKVGDDYYATPVGADSFVLFYNKTKLDEAGLEYPDADTTWEEIAEMAKATTVRDENGIPQSLGMASTFGTHSAIPLIFSKGGRFLDDMNNPTKVVFDSPETVEALTWLQNAANDGGFMPNGEDSTYLTGGFSAGQYTFYISGVYDIVYLSEIEDFEWDIAPLPGSMQNKGDTAVLYAGYGVSSQSENPELAKEFAYFMTTYEAQQIMAETGLITPLRKDVAYSDEVLKFDGAPEHHSIRVDNLPYGQNVEGLTLAWGEMTDVFSNYMSQLKAKTITPAECATAIQTECQVILDEYNSK